MELLIVDDDREIRLLLRELTREFDADVHEFVDGSDAVEYCRDHRADLVLLVVCMKRMNGIEAARIIHGLQPLADILIITQYDTPEYHRQAEEAGTRGYFTKDDLRGLKQYLRTISSHTAD